MVVENGLGLNNANSYVDIAYADDYFSTRGIAEWEALQNKEALLIRATDFVDTAYGDKMSGVRLNNTQALEFPRREQVVPTNLKKAVCELALKANIGELMSDVERLTKREKVGSIEVEYAENADATTKYTYVLSLLKPLLKDNYSSAFLRAERC